MMGENCWSFSWDLTPPPLFAYPTAVPLSQFISRSRQIESATPAQFIPILVKDGSMDTLKDLLTSLANRLQWRSSEQALPLFPSSTPPPDAHPADESECVQSTDGTGSSGPAAVATAAAANIFSDDEPDTALSLSDAILTRAVLCSSGLVVALASTARRNQRRKSTADGGGCSFDDARWRREMRALAEGEGEGSTITVGEGAAAIDRVLREMQAWESRGRGMSVHRSWWCEIRTERIKVAKFSMSTTISLDPTVSVIVDHLTHRHELEARSSAPGRHVQQYSCMSCLSFDNAQDLNAPFVPCPPFSPQNRPSDIFRAYGEHLSLCQVGGRAPGEIPFEAL